MKHLLTLLIAALFSLTACKKEESADSTNPSASWRVNNAVYTADSVTCKAYSDYPNDKYVYAYSSANGLPIVLRLSLKNVPFDRSSLVGTHVSLDTSIAVALYLATTPKTSAAYFTYTTNTGFASITAGNGKVSISLPDIWLYQYHYSGSYVTGVDSVRFSCNIQVPARPEIIESPRNYWKLNDTVFKSNGGAGIGYPYGSNRNTSYSFWSDQTGMHRILNMRFVNARVIDTPRTPFQIRVGSLFMIQLYAGNGNAPENASYGSADTTNIFATIGSSKEGRTTITIPEMWVYRWRPDASGNPIRDSARFSCEFQRDGN